MLDKEKGSHLERKVTTDVVYDKLFRVINFDIAPIRIFQSLVIFFVMLPPLDEIFDSLTLIHPLINYVYGGIINIKHFLFYQILNFRYKNNHKRLCDLENVMCNEIGKTLFKVLINNYVLLVFVNNFLCRVLLLVL